MSDPKCDAMTEVAKALRKVIPLGARQTLTFEMAFDACATALENAVAELTVPTISPAAAPPAATQPAATPPADPAPAPAAQTAAVSAPAATPVAPAAPADSTPPPAGAGTVNAIAN